MTEQIDELSKKTLGSYIQKATTDVHNKAYRAGKKEGGEKKYDVPNIQGSIMRQIGIEKAVKKITKEEIEMNENLENILVHAWNKDAVNLRSALDAEMQSRIEDHVQSMVTDVSARLFNQSTVEEESEYVDEATWHQSKSKARMDHPTSWSVVTDPPNEGRSAILHKTEKDANDYLENLKKNNPKAHKHSYILKPRG